MNKIDYDVKIEQIKKDISSYKSKINLRIFGLKNTKNKLEDRLIEVQTELLRNLDSDGKYEELINILNITKKQLLNSKGYNKFSLITEIIDLLPFSGYSAFISTPATMGDLVSQYKMKKKIYKLYKIIENDETIDLYLKHINTSIESDIAAIIESIETSLEFVGFFRRLVFGLSLFKVGITGYNTYLLYNIGKELDQLHNYLEDKIKKAC